MADITAPVSMRISVVSDASRRISSPSVPGSLMNGNIVIGIGSVIAPRARAVENHPLDPVAINLAKCRTKPGQDRVYPWVVGHCFLTACIIQEFGGGEGPAT